MRNPLGDTRLILCSASPRRRELLSGIGLPVELTSVQIDETPDPATPLIEVAEEIAVRKANAWEGALADNQILVTADTVVLLDGKLLAKPADADEARIMLSALSGQTHQVITGVCLRTPDQQVSFSDTTEVVFKKLLPEEIDYYISVHQPFDKAGSYGVQEYIGYIGVERLSGSFYNVMGLPMHRLYEELRKLRSDQ